MTKSFSDCGDGYTVNILNIIELHTLNGWIIRWLNYIPIKLKKKRKRKKRKREGGREEKETHSCRAAFFHPACPLCKPWMSSITWPKYRGTLRRAIGIQPLGLWTEQPWASCWNSCISCSLSSQHGSFPPEWDQDKFSLCLQHTEPLFPGMCCVIEKKTDKFWICSHSTTTHQTG